MDLTTYAENFLINYLLRGQSLALPSGAYLGLFSSATDEDGGGTEASGGSYSRQPLTMGPGVNTYTAVNTNVLAFSNMPVGTWTHAAIFDAVSGGNMLFHGALPFPKNTSAGQTLPVEAEAVQTVLSGHLTPVGAAAVYATIFMGTFSGATDVYLHLLTSLSPEVEVSGGVGYAPQPLPLTEPIDGVTWNESIVTFDDVDTGGLDIVGAELWHEGDYPLLRGPLVTPISDPAGGQVVFALGEFELTLR